MGIYIYIYIHFWYPHISLVYLFNLPNQGLPWIIPFMEEVTGRKASWPIWVLSWCVCRCLQVAAPVFVRFCDSGWFGFGESSLAALFRLVNYYIYIYIFFIIYIYIHNIYIHIYNIHIYIIHIYIYILFILVSFCWDVFNCLTICEM